MAEEYKNETTDPQSYASCDPAAAKAPRVLSIAPSQPDDRDAVCQECLLTAENGRDATELAADPSMPGPSVSEPAAGSHASVAPAKFASRGTRDKKGTYAYERRFLSGEALTAVLPDSGQSQLNQCESSLALAVADNHSAVDAHSQGYSQL